MAEDTRKLVGVVELHFLEDDEGTWYSELQELDKEKCLGDLRSIYKLALISAVIQDTLRTKLPAMDALIKTNKEIQQIHNELSEEKGRNKSHKAWQKDMDNLHAADVDKFQTKLQFEEKTG